jgi:ethanolamine utilization cobalamin adenosyltransferase
MAIVTEAELREQIRRPSRGLRVVVPAGSTFSPSAEDFVRSWQLQVEYVRAPSPSPRQRGSREQSDRPAWDRPGDFPVRLEGEVPVCVTCGARVTAKPDHLTQLDPVHFAPKTSPRIRLRGKLDTVHAMALLAGSRARAQGLGDLAAHLESVAAYSREILSAEYAARPAARLEIAGLDEDQLRAVTHDPVRALGLEHLVPDTSDDEILLWLNWLRCEVREAELAALEAFPSDPETGPARASIAHGLNRLASAVYYLELLHESARGARRDEGAAAAGAQA